MKPYEFSWTGTLTFEPLGRVSDTPPPLTCSPLLEERERRDRALRLHRYWSRFSWVDEETVLSPSRDSMRDFIELFIRPPRAGVDRVQYPRAGEPPLYLMTPHELVRFRGGEIARVSLATVELYEPPVAPGPTTYVCRHLRGGH